MKNEELEKYHNKQLNSETQYDLKPYQILIIVIISSVIGLFLKSEDLGLSNDYELSAIVVLIFIIFILFPPILLIFLGNFIQKLIHRIAKTKYHIHIFPLFAILFCSAIFIATIFIVIRDFYNHVPNPEAPKMILIATGFLFYALSLSNKVVTKNDNKNKSQKERAKNSNKNKGRKRRIKN